MDDGPSPGGLVEAHADQVELVLASASPRRAQLLGLLDRPFEVRIAEIDESVLDGEEPAAHVERLARHKVGAIESTTAEIVIGADTVVVIDGDIIGKPDDVEHATAILERLSGRSHLVLTGVAVRRGTSVRSAVAATTVTMRAITPDEIATYIASGEPMDKAGAYGLQGIGGRFVERIDGSHHNVVGLPLTVVEQLISELIASS